MNRRDLNRILMLGTALAGGWPAWLRRAFGAESGRGCPLPGGQEGALRWRRIVSAAYRRAQQAGKPLLALVAPATGGGDAERGFEKMWDRGRAFGELLNHGDDEALATLALAEIVCAPISALRALSAVEGEPLMVLFETDVIPPRGRALDVELPQSEPWPRRSITPEDLEARIEEERHTGDGVMDRRMQALSRLLHEGLRATPRMLANRAAQARSRLGMPGPAGLAEGAGPAQLHRVSALLLASAVGLPERERQVAVGRIADAARFVLCRRPVPGSRWFNAGALASEDSPDEATDTDGGPEDGAAKSRRFLHFLSHDATWRRPS
jgi:hypothetical protein